MLPDVGKIVAAIEGLIEALEATQREVRFMTEQVATTGREIQEAVERMRKS